MNTWVPKNKIVKFVIVIAAMSIVLYFCSLFVTLKQIKKVENFYNDTESEFSKNEKFVAIKSIVEANQEVISELRSFLIQKGDEVKFIEKIENVARDSNVKFEIKSIDAKSVEDESSFKEDVLVKMNIDGSWESVMLFVDKLEKLPFGVSITGISLDALSSENWAGFVEFVIFREK